MPAMEPLSNLIGIKLPNLSKKENILLEAELFLLVCEELKKIFKKQYQDYFSLMKFTIEKENKMLEEYLICLIIRDILSTEEYTLEGIACYTDTHKDVVEEIFTGQNMSPSATFLRKLIELHRTVRRTLYFTIMKKVTSDTSSS